MNPTGQPLRTDFSGSCRTRTSVRQNCPVETSVLLGGNQHTRTHAGWARVRKRPIFRSPAPAATRLRATMRNMSEPTNEALGDADTNLGRRRFLTVCSAAGVANMMLPGALLALASQSAPAQAPDAAKQAPFPKITPEMIDAAATDRKST